MATEAQYQVAHPSIQKQHKPGREVDKFPWDVRHSIHFTLGQNHPFLFRRNRFLGQPLKEKSIKATTKESHLDCFQQTSIGFREFTLEIAEGIAFWYSSSTLLSKGQRRSLLMPTFHHS